MNKLNVAVVGCGAISKTHIEAIKKNEKVKLYAVCDSDKLTAQEVALAQECKYYTNFDEMLEEAEIDIIHVCTPHYLHFPMVCKSLEKGKHVLTEKPLGMNQKECEVMKELAEASQYKAAVCMQNRLNSTSIALEKIVREETYGKIKGMRALVSWNRGEEYYKGSTWKGKWEYEGGGLLMNQMIHTLDLMQWIGGAISQIKGQVSNRLLQGIIEEEDTAEATLWFENGTVGSFYGTNTYSMNASVMLEIHLERGTLRLQDKELILIQEDYKECIATDRGMTTGKDYWGKSHEGIINQFYDAILKGHDNYMKINEGINSVIICQEIYKVSGIKR